MQIKPINIKKEPEYPTEYLFINNPELFNSYMPLRWRANKVVSSALLAFILAGANSLNSCSNDKKAIELKVNNENILIEHDSIDKSKEDHRIFLGGFSPSVIITEKDSNKFFRKSTSKQKNDFSKIAHIAPIFVHGNGHGSIGCIVMSAPVFISESEAMEIISSELKKENLLIDTINCSTITFQADAIADDCYNINEINKTHQAKLNIKMNGLIKNHNILFKFTTLNDYFKFKSDSCYSSSSVSGFDTKLAAELIRNGLSKQSRNYAVVFYDPIPYINFDYNKLKYKSTFIEELLKLSKFENEIKEETEKAKQKAKELLTAQVRDFIQWMKNEGMIK